MRGLVLFALLALTSASLFQPEQYQFLFTKWVQQHNKRYDVDEFFHRFSIFKDNLDFVHQHNTEDHSYKVAVNQFADLTNKEFQQLNGYSSVPMKKTVKSSDRHHTVTSNPSAIDWRSKGAVTNVKDQGQCGSCWSFSATGSTEGAWALAKGQLIPLSEQQLMDCSTSYGNAGCEGGMMDPAFQYIIANGGITTEAAYPYTAQDGSSCLVNSSTQYAVTLSSFGDVTLYSDSAMETAVARQPVSVAIEADQQSFQFYSSGVYSDTACGTQLDHGVLVVGYGVDTNQKYWIVKNSWGASWGDSGYIRIARVADSSVPKGTENDGICGIYMAPSYPVV